jgi:glycerophosphoryl diester phosphodiesterase
VSHPGEGEIIGRRGYATSAPENTLVSIEAALSAGSRAVEFDVLDLNHEIALRDPSVVRRAKDEGVGVVPWTVHEPDEATRLGQAAGVTGFMIDHVDRLLAWADQESS